MDLVELQNVVDAIVEKKRLDRLRPHELLTSIHRKSFPASALPIIEPLLHIKDGATYKYAIDMVGKMKGASRNAFDAIEAAWKRTWEHDVPQACKEAFRTLLRIGNNNERLLAMATRARVIANYGIHRKCAETLMKLCGGKDILAKWNETIPGKCDCDLHRKLASKITDHFATA
jgi:hypothetical protein